MATIKAIFSLFEVILFAVGIIPLNTNIDYGGNDYIAPEITTPMYIVENGETDYVIVTEENPDECILTAVDELQTYIEKISGAELDHITESELADSQNTIILGIGENLDADAFTLKADSGNLYISGGSNRGTLYGVYTLIEEHFGVRWFTPTLEVVPESKNIAVDANLDRTVVP